MTALQDAGEIGAAAGAVFFVFRASRHVGPLPAIGAEGPRHAGKFGRAAGDIGLKGGERVRRDVGIAVEDKAFGIGGAAQFCLYRGVVALPVSGRKGDDRAGAGAAGGFGQIGGQAEIGGRPDGEDEVGAGIGQVDAGAVALDDPAARDGGKKAGRLACDGSVAVGPGQAGLWEKGVGVEQPAALPAADVEDIGRIGVQVSDEISEQEVVHHRAGFFPGKFREMAQVGRKRQVAAVEKAFPRNGGETVEHLVCRKVEEVDGQSPECRKGGVADADKVGHRRIPDTEGTVYNTLQTTALVRMQGVAPCG